MAVHAGTSPAELGAGEGVTFATDLAAERVLRASEARLRSILESAPNMILTADPGGILFVNRVFPPHRGPADAIGTSIYDYVSEADQERVRANVAHVLASGEVTSWEVTSPQPFGPITFSVHAGPVRVGAAIVGVTLVTWDITERVSFQAQLMAADRLTSAGVLASGVAHEVNNPLMCVLANLSAVVSALDRAGAADVGDLRAHANAALEGAARIRDIVRDLRSVAPDEERHHFAIDVRETLESSLRMAQHEIEGRARVVRDCAEVPPLCASESRLGQVFLNLLLNAAQSIPEGHAADHEIRLAIRPDDAGNVVVEISDTGRGIRPDMVPRVFEPFMTTKPADVGSGLGLYVCHHIVKSLRGRIEVVQSTPAGTLLRVTLPRGEEAGVFRPIPTRWRRRAR